MNSTLGRVLFALSVVVPVIAAAQAQVAPREFPEFRGTWMLDDAAGRGRIAGLPVALVNMITDAYSVSGDVLTIERQLSVVQTPPGVLVTLLVPRNNRQTLVYRRAPDVAAR